MHYTDKLMLCISLRPRPPPPPPRFDDQATFYLLKSEGVVHGRGHQDPLWMEPTIDEGAGPYPYPVTHDASIKPKEPIRSMVGSTETQPTLDDQVVSPPMDDSIVHRRHRHHDHHGGLASPWPTRRKHLANV